MVRFIYIGFSIILLAFVAIGVLIAKKFSYPKKLRNEIKQAKDGLLNTLAQDKRHLKFLKQINFSAVISFGASALLGLTFILLTFVPVFKIDVILFSQNFSYCDAVSEIISANKDVLFAIATLLAPFAALIGTLVNYFQTDFKSFDGEARAKKIYIDFYADGKYKRPMYLAPLITACYAFAFTLTVQIFCVVCWNGEDGGTLFQACNGVSGFIAFPIITFIAGTGLSVYSVMLKNNLKKQICAE